MAASDSNRPIKNAAFRIAFGIHNITDGSLISGATGLDSEISKDGASFSDCTNEATEIGTTGIYTLDLSATEMSAEEIIVQVKTSSSNAFIPVREIRTEPCLDSGVAASATGSTITLASTATATADLYNGADIEIVRGTGAGQVRTITDYTAARVATVDRDWTTNPDTTSVYLIHPKSGTPQTTSGKGDVDVQAVDGDTDAATSLKAYCNAIVTGSVDDASPTTTTFTGASGLSTDDDFYNDMILVFTSGTLAGIPRAVTDYDGSTLQFTTGTFPTAPSDTDEFMLLAIVV